MKAYSGDHLIIDGNSYVLFCMMKKVRFWPNSIWDILSWLDKMLSQMNITFFFNTNLVPHTGKNVYLKFNCETELLVLVQIEMSRGCETHNFNFK